MAKKKKRNSLASFAGLSRANRRRCEAPDGFNHNLSDWSLSDWFLAVVGELGESANVAKKLKRIEDGVRGNREYETRSFLRDKLEKELGDVVIHLDLLAQSAGISLGDAVANVFELKSREIGYKPGKKRSKRGQK